MSNLPPTGIPSGPGMGPPATGMGPPPGMGGPSARPDTNETEFLIASWVLAISWGIVVMQLTTYFHHRKRDSLLLQGVVLFVFICETACTVLDFVAVHFQVNVFQAGSVGDSSMHMTASTMGFFSHTSICIVNLFLIWRYHLLTRGKTWIVCSALAILSIGQCASNYYINVLAVRTVVYSNRRAIPDLLALVDKIHVASKVSLSLEFAVVAAVYVLLLVELIGWLRKDLLAAKKLVRHLLYITAESGTVTLVLAGVTLANSVHNAPASTMVILGAIASRTYFMTMLFNLNMRHHQGSLVAGGEPSLSHLTTQLRTRPGNTVAQNISLHKETFIRIDHELPVQTQEQLEHEKGDFASIERGQRDAF